MYLVSGTILNNRYEIEAVLGHGGFGITYAALDKLLNVKVAIKEYLPRQLATRAEGQNRVSVFTGEARQQYDYGLRKFLEEAQSMARFAHHPNVVSARDYFEANGTAYMVMEYVEGVTLKQYLANKGGRVPFQEAKGIMMPVMDALREVHQAGMLHRDISPDNIYITTSAQVKILDFGAARYFTGEQSKSLSVILKSGYAPEEQYRSSGKQGPWTDVYATAATLYKLLTGQTPPDALDRMAGETLTPPSQLGAAIPSAAEHALLRSLEVHAGQRYQTMGDFQQALLGGGAKDGQFQTPPEPLPPEPKTDYTPVPTSAITVPPPSAISEPAPPPSRYLSPPRNSANPAAIAASIFAGVIGLILLAVLMIYLANLWGHYKQEQARKMEEERRIEAQRQKEENEKQAKEHKEQEKKKQQERKEAEREEKEREFLNLLAEGRQYLKEQRYEKAREVFERAVQLEDNNAFAHYELGIAYSNLIEHDKAIKAFSKSIQIRPVSFGSHYNIGISYGKLENYNEAIKAFEDALKINPKNPDARYRLGLSYISNRNKRQAMKQYDELKKQDSQKARKLFDLIKKTKF